MVLQKLSGDILSMDKGILLLVAIGVLGLLLKMISNTYLNSLIKASENMATTKKKRFRIMRQKYENGRTFGIQGTGRAFAEKQVRCIKLFGAPLMFWERSGLSLSLIAWFIMAGAFIYKDASWRGSPEMVTFLASGVMVCAFLLVLENIFVTKNKVEILKANILDYLEKITPKRDVKNHGIEQLKENRLSGNHLGEKKAFEQEMRGEKLGASGKEKLDRTLTPESKQVWNSKQKSGSEDLIRGKTVGESEIASGKEEIASSLCDAVDAGCGMNVECEENVKSSEELDRFLKEFFS